MVGFAKNQLLNFEKFLNPNQALSVFAVTSGFAAITRRKSQISLRQFFFFQNFFAMVSHHRHFGRAAQIIVVLRFIQVFGFARQVASAVKKFFLDDCRRDKRRKIFLAVKFAA